MQGSLISTAAAAAAAAAAGDGCGNKGSCDGSRELMNECAATQLLSVSWLCMAQVAFDHCRRCLQHMTGVAAYDDLD
jgi:hypothetical protein